MFCEKGPWTSLCGKPKPQPSEEQAQSSSVRLSVDTFSIQTHLLHVFLRAESARHILPCFHHSYYWCWLIRLTPRGVTGWTLLKLELFKQKNGPLAACSIQGILWSYVKHNIYLTRLSVLCVLRFFSIQLERILQAHKKKKNPQWSGNNLWAYFAFNLLHFPSFLPLSIQLFLLPPPSLTPSSLGYFQFAKFETNKLRLKIHSEAFNAAEVKNRL